MSTHDGLDQTYTIKEAAELTGLPESNLRYYETIGLIPTIRRDSSSKYRVYDEADIDYIVSIACLSATGMSIDDMKIYLANASKGIGSAQDQVKLLNDQNRKLEHEQRSLELRRRYLTIKADYWEAVATHDNQLAVKLSAEAVVVAKQVKRTQQLH